MPLVLHASPDFTPCKVLHYARPVQLERLHPTMALPTNAQCAPLETTRINLGPRSARSVPQARSAAALM